MKDAEFVMVIEVSDKRCGRIYFCRDFFYLDIDF